MSSVLDTDASIVRDTRLKMSTLQMTSWSEKDESHDCKRSGLHSELIQTADENFVSVEDNEKISSQLPQSSCKRNRLGAPSSGHVIRNRFLNRLGIRSHNQRGASNGSPTSRKPPVSAIAIERADSFCESLKADKDETDHKLDDDRTCTTMTSSSLESYQSQLSPRSDFKSVSFREHVLVHPIPPRNAYSDRMRKQLWTPPHIQQMNTARNIYEFASEEWDWKKVVDDELFISWYGQKIHPIHLQECSLNQQFLSVMSQR